MGICDNTWIAISIPNFSDEVLHQMNDSKPIYLVTGEGNASTAKQACLKYGSVKVLYFIFSHYTEEVWNTKLIWLTACLYMCMWHIMKPNNFQVVQNLKDHVQIYNY